ncbi:MAG: AAC(3) family N-acetyltransferase [Sedimentisphaerales bacterium]|nr:AAC(3) family N-acetyltransferase [Sedimentisphaerales bacterium]
MSKSYMRKNSNNVSKEEIVTSLKQTGLKLGDVVFVHSAMRTLGWVDGGAQTVVSAFLEVIGERGTLVVPTFTFAHEAEEEPIIDPANDPSEMGIITETVRRRPDALRSTAFRHSVAAVGRRAGVITEVDPALSPFDLRSSFGVMLSLNTQIVLLGMTYATSTSHHVSELLCEVPYRHTLELDIKVRQQDGSIIKQKMTDYQPKPSGTGSYYGSRHPDFNRLGKMIEDKGLVGIATIGNAVVRRFGLRDLADLALVEAEKDYNIFRTPEGEPDYYTPLEFGKVVFSPEMLDGAGRPGKYQWCVVDESKLAMPNHNLA